jgi:acetyltransferase-like isoleucine patch superfamily enzyme
MICHWHKQLRYACRLLSTRLTWGLRFGSLGRRVTLGRCRIGNQLKAVFIGEHTMITDDWSFASLTTDEEPAPVIRIGAWCRIQHDFQINVRTRVVVGDHCLIGPRVFITDADHVMPSDDSILSDSRAFHCAPVIIEESCWLGVNAVILKGVTIGHHSVIGANSVVTKSVPPRSIVVGSPARVVGQVGQRPADKGLAS